MGASVQRLGVNRGRYHGETVAIDSMLTDMRGLAASEGWHLEELPTADGSLMALRRPGGPGATRVYVSAGIHGDEPAGPLAVHHLFATQAWPASLDLWVCPCLNPTGFRLNQRESATGDDLNRDYRHLRTAEVRAHVEWLGRQPSFDLTLCLHEDWEASGFYLYELNPDGNRSPSEAVIRAVSEVCPIDASPLIDGREASGGIIRPQLDPATRADWPEAFYLVQHRTRHSFTLEAPSDFPLSVRVAALTTAMGVLLETA